MSTGSFRKLPCKILELRLDLVLACGQSFRWTKNPDGDWIGVIGRSVFKLRQTEDHLEYQAFPSVSTEKSRSEEPFRKRSRSTEETTQNAKNSEKNSEKILEKNSEKNLEEISEKTDHLSTLERFFALETSLLPLYDVWTASDEKFAAVSKNFSGIRILQQNFIETLFSFICSSNNNIQRIQQMVEKLCINFGNPICELEGRTFYSFPEVVRLAKKEVEGELRKLGFGYRAGFVQKSAQYIIEHPEWLEEVQRADYPTAKSLLMELTGVGAKVADCICLMALGHHGAVPVDTHVFRVTAEHYLPSLRGMKSVTPRVYDQIGDFYRQRFGPWAGWAHSVLFTADLARFKENQQKTTSLSTKQKNKK